jgi:tetratricopeptide (TPR) repeat protein
MNTNEIPRPSLSYQQKSTEEIEKDADDRMDNSYSGADFYVDLGDRLWQQKKLTETVDAYRQAIELETKSPQVYYRMAEALKQLGNFEEAAFYYRLAVSIQSNNRSTTEASLTITDMAGEMESNLTEDGAELTFPFSGQTVQIYLEQANSYLEEQKWDAAILACQEALKTSPELAEAYKIWGNALQRQGKISDAMGYYAKALMIAPDSPEIYANLGSVCAQKQKWQEALEYYHKAIELNPDFAGVYRNLAKVWTQLGESDKAEAANKQAIAIEANKPKLPQAIAREDRPLNAKNLAARSLEEVLEYYSQALKQQPNSLELYRSLAPVLEKLQRWEDAAACYRKIAELERVQMNKSVQLPQLTQSNDTSNNNTKASERATLPPEIQTDKSESAEVYIRAGNALVQQQQWQQAIAVYERALVIETNRPDIYRQIAKIVAKLGKKDVAADYWYRALDLEQKQAAPTEYLQLGHLWQELNRKERASDCYRRALKLQPALDEAYHHLGAILADAGNLTELVELYKLAISHNPNNPEHYLHLAEVCRHQGNWQIATACYQKALTIAPDNWEIHHILADVWLKQEKYAEASVSYRQAIALNPNSFWSCHNLGYALLKQKSFQDASMVLQQAIALKSDFFWTYYNLGDAFIQLQEWEKAAAAFEQVLQLQPNFSPARQKLQYVAEQKSNMGKG